MITRNHTSIVETSVPTQAYCAAASYTATRPGQALKF